MPIAPLSPFMTAIFCMLAWSMAIIENFFIQFYERQNNLWKFLCIHQNAFVPGHAYREDWVVAIKYNMIKGKSRGQVLKLLLYPPKRKCV